MTKDDARRFFIGKVVSQAEADGVILSSNERRMLDWSEVEPGCVADPAVAEGLAQEMSDEEYEGKIARLLERAFSRDIESAPERKQSYEEAYSTLKGGDFYLLIIVEQALRSRLRKWWQFWL
jgi:hypothetical protein